MFRAALTDDTADNNSSYGFYATYKNTKDSGNKAKGNGTNCYKVSCK